MIAAITTLHEHLEPVGDARRRPAGPQRPRARAARASPGSRRRWRPGRRSSPSTSSAPASTRTSTRSASTSSATAARPASATRGPLPEAISAAVDDADLAVVLGPVGQPQLRGPHQPRREDELPRVAAARRRLRAAGTMDCDLVDDPIGHGRRGRGRLPARPVALGAGDRRDDRARRAVGHVPQVLRRGVRRRRALERARGADRRPLRLGRRLDLRAAPALLRRHAPASPSRSPTSRAPASWRSSATRSRPTTSRPRARSSAAARRPRTSRSTASRRASSTATARAAATTRSWSAGRSRTSACATCWAPGHFPRAA